MSTNGTYGVKLDGVLKALYCHWDGYPSGLGVDVAKDYQALKSDPEKFKRQARELKVVNEASGPVPPKTAEKLQLWTNQNVGGAHSGWYKVTRDLQGNLRSNLAIGYGYSGENMGGIEWSYIIDLDSDRFLVFQGPVPPVDHVGPYRGRRYDFETPYASIPLDELTPEWVEALEA